VPALAKAEKDQEDRGEGKAVELTTATTERAESSSVSTSTRATSTTESTPSSTISIAEEGADSDSIEWLREQIKVRSIGNVSCWTEFRC